MSSEKNVSYIFIPFTFDKQADFAPLIDKLDGSYIWNQVHDEILYMLKYVADKINSHDRGKCQCFHYTLNVAARSQFGLSSEAEWYTTKPHNYKGKEEKFRFRILGVELYCFRTTVCIIAYKICMEKNDPIWISSAQYYLKKVSREKISLDCEDAETFTLLDVSKMIIRELSDISSFDFFYYVNPSTERANVLTYLEVEAKKDYKYELFYLRRCYNEGYIFAEDEKLDNKEIYISSKDIIWGISPEAAVCLTCPALGRGDFIHGTFYRNFNAQYLFMYVLLLHQKYVLYMFLTKIGIGVFNSLETLEEYRNHLYEFETDFVFSCVTEVPQYQNLYERMMQAFSLRKMYEDVHEPLLSLSEVRRVISENEQKKRDENVNKALFGLSILSFFSALVDSFDFVDSFFGWFLSSSWIKAIQIMCIGLIIIIVINVIISLIKFRHDRSDD